MKAQRIVSGHAVAVELAAGAFRGPTLAVLEASPNPIVAVDQAGRISYLNPRVEFTFGYRRDELLGQPVEVLMPLGAIFVSKPVPTDELLAAVARAAHDRPIPELRP